MEERDFLLALGLMLKVARAFVNLLEAVVVVVSG
jgi:hypothetical protein